MPLILTSASATSTSAVASTASHQPVFGSSPDHQPRIAVAARYAQTTTRRIPSATVAARYTASGGDIGAPPKSKRETDSTPMIVASVAATGTTRATASAGRSSYRRACPGRARCR